MRLVRWIRRALRRAAAARQEGQAAVEFALVLPLLLLLVLGIAQFGQALFAYLTIQNAAWSGARAAALPGASSAAVVQVVDQSAATLGAANLTVNVAWAGTPPPSGSPVTVTVQYAFSFLNNILSGPLQLTAASTMQVE